MADKVTVDMGPVKSDGWSGVSLRVYLGCGEELDRLHRAWVELKRVGIVDEQLQFGAFVQRAEERERKAKWGALHACHFGVFNRYDEFSGREWSGEEGAYI